MAIISFWNEKDKENGQTCSAMAIAIQMAIEHNYRILLVDATFSDKTIEKAFWRYKENKALKQLQGNRIDVSSGAEGLISAVASNKATPEIIANFTRVVFKNRLDILLGLKTEIPEEHEKSIMLYKDMLTAANKYYDLIFVDVMKSYRRATSKALIEKSDMIIYTMPPNLDNIDNFIKLRQTDPIISTNKVLPLLAKSDELSKYNVRNTTRYIKNKYLIPCIPYNTRFMEACNEADIANFFTSPKLNGTALKNPFIVETERVCTTIITKLKELHLS